METHDAQANQPKSGTDVKDTFFRKLFSEKTRAIELCNALVGTNYPPHANAIMCNLDESLLRRYNDSAIAVENQLFVFSEHQSTINRNMPLRLLSYATDVLYTWFVKMNEIYKEKVYKIPTPKFYVLYNGEKKLTHDVLRLSDAFEIKADEFSLELTVRVLNVNYGSGCETLNKSPSLNGYAYLVALIRQHQRNGLDRDKAISSAINQCIEKNILADFLQAHYKEAAIMFARNYSWEDEKAAIAEEAAERGMEQGREQGREQGMEQGKELGLFQAAKQLLKTGMALNEIVKALELSDHQAEELARVTL